VAPFIRNRFIETTVAVALVAASVGPLRAQTTSHSHDAAATHTLTLNQGRKSATDEPLGAAHAGKLTPEQYRDLATQVETEVADIGAGADAMAAKDAPAHPASGLVEVAQAVNQYGSHFDRPGFTPIRNVH
jgi:hypothetical protein